MKVVIAGGRDYFFTDSDRELLDHLHEKHQFTEVVSGGCSGADEEGALWAASKGIPVVREPADWNKHGRRAGPIRNRKMAEYADSVILFPGGRGTSSMRAEALRAGRRIIYDFVVDGT